MKQELDVAAEMRHALARDLGTALCFRNHEGTLQYRLRIERETLSGPARLGRVQRFRQGDVLGDAGGVDANISLARAADRGVGLVGLLHHRAKEAGELGDGAGDDRAPEMDVAEQAIERISEFPIG